MRNPKCRCGHEQPGHTNGYYKCRDTNCLCAEYRPNALCLARWKVTRKTCGECGRGFGDNTGSSICDRCLTALLGLT